ncbi:MAG: Hsp20 family protein [Rhodoferax sp.]|nr:Hsp20 family protein [Rhodoferax sp.]
MFFAATQTPIRRQSYAPLGRTMERFLDEALTTARQQSCAYQQDENSFTLSLDVPGVTREQLTIGIEGAVVRIQTKEDAPRNYRAAYELPLEVDTTSSVATLENGVLTLKLAKKVPVSNVTKLTIN